MTVAWLLSSAAGGFVGALVGHGVYGALRMCGGLRIRFKNERYRLATAEDPLCMRRGPAQRFIGIEVVGRNFRRRYFGIRMAMRDF